jgi:hypothetical protein
MAILNELGRNSAAVSYGPYGTGQDLFPTLQAVDGWLRNDTWQGYASAASTTLTGVGSVWTTQARGGDYILVAGQQRIVATNGVVSDTSITVTAPFSPAITIPSAVKVINSLQPTVTGTIAYVSRGTTNGVVAVTNGSSVINGVGTSFLSELTNAVTTVTLSGTVAVDTAGNITGSGTSFLSGQGTNNGLYPGDSLAIVSLGQTYYLIVSTVTSDTAATVTSTSSVAISAGATIAKATNGTIGRTIQINGRIRQVTAIASTTSFTVNAPMDFTDSNLKLKVYPRGTISNNSAATLYGTSSATGSGVNLTVAATVTSPQASTGPFLPGVVITGTGVPVGTTIVNQQYGATGASATSQVSSGTSGTNIISVAATTSIVVGHFVSGNGAAVSGIPAGTYVIGISGLNIYLSNNLTGTVSAATVYFFVPGQTGVYTTSVATTISATACTTSVLLGNSTNFAWDLGITNLSNGLSTPAIRQASALDQVWIGDEVRTFNFNNTYGGISSAVIAYATDYVGYTGTAIGPLRQTVTAITFKREDSYINGSGTSFTTDLRVGDDVIIDGTEVTVSQIVSDTQIKITSDFTHSPTASTLYKKLKIHGYTMEGTREGGPGTSGKFSNSTTGLAAAGSIYPAGTISLTVAAAPTITGPYLPVKISGAGGPPLVLTGQATCATSTVSGTNTLFTTQLHIGAEIILAGQYLTVTAIASDTSLTVSQTATVAAISPIYRSVPLFTYITAGTTTLTLATPLKQTIYSVGANPPQVSFPSTGGDFLEYVYSAPNTFAESGTTTLLNQSYDRKYFAFRIFFLFQSTLGTPTATATLATAQGAYSTPVYERWAAGYAGTHGVGINQADLSGGVMTQGGQATTTYTIQQPICGNATAQMSIPTVGTGFPLAPPSATSTQVGLAASTYTFGSQTYGSVTTIVPWSLNGVYDITGMSQVSGGFIYLFATKRYAVLQGKTFSNLQTQWVGVVEFERAQPEDTGTGLGTTSGVSYGGTYGGLQLAQGATPPGQSGTPGFSQSIQYITGVAPWPCYAYVNGNRFPTGSQQIPTLPILQTYPIQGGVFSTPRVRNSTGDLVGFNAHIYSAATITTGRWGHQVEFGQYGGYDPAYLNAVPTVTSNTLTLTANRVPQVHLGQLIPVFTNVYNSKRFMFSPVAVLGPSYDPDVRGRFFGMKVIPSNLGTLMDTVSITSNATTFFYDSAQSAVDHWVLTTPATTMATTLTAGQTPVLTERFTLTQNSALTQQSWRSLEDSSVQASSTAGVFYNNFRVAFPA